MIYDKIPQELRNECCWVNVWNGSKIPMNCREQSAASSSNPTTWNTFDCVMQAVQDGRYDGIGYVFHDTGLVGIDIDDGFADGLINSLAADIMQACKSYTEKSRSGRGVHILLRGKLPFTGQNNRENVEIYRTGRYFIMTGNVLLYDEIIENQAAIDYVVERYFPERVRESNSVMTSRFYSPQYKHPENGKVSLVPHYPEIKPGCRNDSLTSLAGQLHSQGYGKREMYAELLRANAQACKPPLGTREIEMIVNSVTRYRR